MSPASSGSASSGKPGATAKNNRSQNARYSGHFWSARKSSRHDLISTIQISPLLPTPATSARRPFASTTSPTTASPWASSTLPTPRKIANAARDCRPSRTSLSWVGSMTMMQAAPRTSSRSGEPAEYLSERIDEGPAPAFSSARSAPIVPTGTATGWVMAFFKRAPYDSPAADTKGQVTTVAGRPQPLEAPHRRRVVNPATLAFKTTDELHPITGLIGQDRALKAIQFGANIKSHDFNIFVLGPAASGKTTAVKAHLGPKAAEAPTPADWVYVYNFENPNRPKALQLPHGRGKALARGMVATLDELRSVLPARFESED